MAATPKPDQQKQAEQKQEKTLGERFQQWRQDNFDRLPAAGAEFSAIGREMLKDVRETMHQTFFGQREGPGEPGAPLNPTMQEVTSDREILGDYNQRLDQHAGKAQGQSEQRGLGR